eukprot:TRINITY_DN11957_c0_g1_i1.p1 TRINITY_DN11957_c0_g1~~TRINITY_DN11957_c0_g1_i1.p1  ORF type:complete len:199 (-),score=20.92 TRINITY_DN11957_c0_g1_i1:69-665(-)
MHTVNYQHSSGEISMEFLVVGGVVVFTLTAILAAIRGERREPPKAAVAVVREIALSQNYNGMKLNPTVDIPLVSDNEEIVSMALDNQCLHLYLQCKTSILCCSMIVEGEVSGPKLLRMLCDIVDDLPRREVLTQTRLSQFTVADFNITAHHCVTRFGQYRLGRNDCRTLVKQLHEHICASQRKRPAAQSRGGGRVLLS